jgi:hypothetical protein
MQVQMKVAAHFVALITRHGVAYAETTNLFTHGYGVTAGATDLQKQYLFTHHQ